MAKEPEHEEKHPLGRPPARSGKIDATPERVAGATFARRSPPPFKLKPDRHQPSKTELNERIHLPGESPEAVGRIVTQSGAPRREPEKTDS